MYFVLGGGGGANKQVLETLICRGFQGNSPPDNFEILKLGNSTYSILNEISKKYLWINSKMTDDLLFTLLILFCFSFC